MYALKDLLHINNNTDYKTILAVLDLLSIGNRVNLMKVMFFMKTKKQKQNSLAHRVCDYLLKQPQLSAADLERIQPLAEYKKIIKDLNLNMIQDPEAEPNREVIENHLKTQMRYIQNKDTIKHLNTQLEKRIADRFRSFCPIKETGGGIQAQLQRYNKISNPIDFSYVPKLHFNNQQELNQILLKCDHNPAWYTPKNCPDCNKQQVQHLKLHQILSCKKNTEQRTNIFNSIITEIAFLRSKLPGTDVISQEAYQTLQDIAETGTTPTSLQHTVMETLLGTTIDTELKNKPTLQIKRMLASHLYLLTNIVKNYQTDYIAHKNLATINLNSPISNITVIENDIKAGKIVVRQKINNQIYYTNIRDIIETLTVPELEHYNLGIGAASTRTDKQKKLADKYTKNLIKTLQGMMIHVDGSVLDNEDTNNNNNKPNNPRPKNKKKHGGYGAVVNDLSTKTDIKTFKGRVKTNDPQIA